MRNPELGFFSDLSLEHKSNCGRIGAFYDTTNDPDGIRTHNQLIMRAASTIRWGTAAPYVKITLGMVTSFLYKATAHNYYILLWEF